MHEERASESRSRNKRYVKVKEKERKRCEKYTVKKRGEDAGG